MGGARRPADRHAAPGHAGRLHQHRRRSTATTSATSRAKTPARSPGSTSGCSGRGRPNGWLRGITIGGEGELVADSDHGRPISRLTRQDASLELADGGRAGLDLDWNVEHLVEPFTIAHGVTLAPGRYRFDRATASYRSDRSRRLSGTIGVTAGEFWSGDMAGTSLAARLRLSARGAVSGTLERHHAILPEGRFDTTLAKLRVDWSFSTRAALNALVQYNSARRARLTNARFSLMHRPLSDVFVVYTETRLDGARPDRSVALKYTHLLSF